MNIQQVLQIIGQALASANVQGVLSVDIRNEEGSTTIYFATMDEEGRRTWELDVQGLREIRPPGERQVS